MATADELKARIKALQLQAKARRARDNQKFAQENMLPSPDTDTTPTTPEDNKFGDTAAEFSAPFRQNIKDIVSRSSFDRPVLDRVKDVGSLALNALATGYSGGAGLFGDIVGGDRTQERKAARDAMLFGEIAVPELAGAPSAVTRFIRQGSKLNDKQEAAKAAKNINVVPTLGSQGAGMGLVEAAFDKIPFSSSLVRSTANRVEGEMSDALDRTVNKVGTATTDTGAGEALQSGAKSFIKGFQDKADDLYGAVDRKIGQETFVTAPKSIGVLEDLTKYSGSYKNIASFLNKPKFTKLLADLQVNKDLNALPYTVLQDLRSNIGRSIGRLNGPISDLPEAELKRLYGALSEDMRAAAAASGKDALQSFERANRFYSAGMKRIDGALKKVTKADTPEKAYSNVKALLTANSPRGSTAQLNQIKKSLPKEEWSNVSATIFKKLGEKTEDGGFNPATFVTNWDKISKSSKAVLTSGNIPQSVSKELDSLSKVARRYKEKPISTGSAATNSLLAFIAGVPTLGIAETLGIASGTFITAAAMTNKPFLKAVNAATASDFTKLRNLAREDTAIGSEAATLLRLIGADQVREEEFE